MQIARHISGRSSVTFRRVCRGQVETTCGRQRGEEARRSGLLTPFWSESVIYATDLAMMKIMKHRQATDTRTHSRTPREADQLCLLLLHYKSRTGLRKPQKNFVIMSLTSHGVSYKLKPICQTSYLVYVCHQTQVNTRE